ncbi:MAG: TIGR00730 family Rossman fold protein [Patescibacteria group bacterium]
MTGKDRKRNEKQIKKAFARATMRTWSDELKGSDSWHIFKVMAEFVEGFERLNKIGPCVSVFGSARTNPGHRHYKLAEEIAYKLTKSGYGIISGGGSGIMEAANKGAQRAGGKSVGLSIVLPYEQRSNPHVDHDKLFNFKYFFVRKVMFVRYAQGFVVLPGGLGTLDELTEALTLIQTEKIARFPIVLMDRAYWAGLLKWWKEVMLEEGNIDKDDLKFFHVVDTPDEAVAIINQFYKKYLLKPNF